MYVLDTNVVSELRKAKTGRANRSVRWWEAQVDTTKTFVSAITVHELEVGILRVERRDPVAGGVLRRWIDDEVYEAFDGRVLPVDADVARAAAVLHVPDPAPVRDSLIAATAIVNEMTVVTRNERDFRRFAQLDVVNPWSSA